MDFNNHISDDLLAKIDEKLCRDYLELVWKIQMVQDKLPKEFEGMQ